MSKEKQVFGGIWICNNPKSSTRLELEEMVLHKFQLINTLLQGWNGKELTVALGMHTAYSMTSSMELPWLSNSGLSLALENPEEGEGVSKEASMPWLQHNLLPLNELVAKYPGNNRRQKLFSRALPLLEE